MKSTRRFNLYFGIALAVIVVAGCKTTEEAKKNNKKEVSLVALHLEVNPDGASDNAPVAIHRTNPVYVNISKTPFLDSTDLETASVVDEPGGLFSIRLKFNFRGSALLEAMTISHVGKRVAVFCQTDTVRWLAAPQIRKGMHDGVFIFTPDATREEADRIVRGLNNAVALGDKDMMKW